MLPAVNYYHKAPHLGCCSNPRSASDFHIRLIQQIATNCQNCVKNAPKIAKSQNVTKKNANKFHSVDNIKK